MPTQREQFAAAIRTYSSDFAVELNEPQTELLAHYYKLIVKWNELHLVAPCSPQDFAIRHVLESMTLLKHLPVAAKVLDVGSGGGLPIVPCLLVRPDLRATLVESSRRKAVFLREALRPVEPADRACVVADRFEDIDLPAADFLTCRALDRFSQLLPVLIQRAKRGTTLMLFAGEDLRDQIQSALPSPTIERLPLSEKRFLIIGSKL